MDSTSPAEWADIPGLEGKYLIRRDGTVRSVARVIMRRNGYPQTVHGRVISSYMNGGYLRVSLSDGGRQAHRLIHRVLAEVFIPNPAGLPVVRHLNDDTSDNRLENLAWGTEVDNAQDRIRNGHNPQSEKRICLRGHPLPPPMRGKRPPCKGCINSKRDCRFCGKTYSRANLRHHQLVQHPDEMSKT